ncbi:unnamed protein product [Lactuca saligna]|uniref:Uncharacterized protein n=1 Tax=Lactuca saligna TaxID=75948 RepID=A0AA35VX77_LACSI|nr:unnamed protein product [Lactuca saligna]
MQTRWSPPPPNSTIKNRRSIENYWPPPLHFWLGFLLNQKTRWSPPPPNSTIRNRRSIENYRPPPLHFWLGFLLNQKVFGVLSPSLNVDVGFGWKNEFVLSLAGKKEEMLVVGSGRERGKKIGEREFGGEGGSHDAYSKIQIPFAVLTSRQPYKTLLPTTISIFRFQFFFHSSISSYNTTFLSSCYW